MDLFYGIEIEIGPRHTYTKVILWYIDRKEFKMGDRVTNLIKYSFINFAQIINEHKSPPYS